MSAADARMPPKPWGANGDRLDPWNAVRASTTNSPSTPSLTATMIVLKRALSRMPATRTSVTPSTSTTAVRLTVPPSPGGLAIEAGMVMEKTDCTRSRR
jgi:hypothetical protein